MDVFFIISSESYCTLEMGYSSTLKIYLYLKNNILALQIINLSTIFWKWFLLQNPMGFEREKITFAFLKILWLFMLIEWINLKVPGTTERNDIF